MHYLVIPDISKYEEFQKLDCPYEYNDFWHPEVYEDKAKVEELISFYKSCEHDVSKDTMHGAFLGLDLAASDKVIRERSRELLSMSMDIASRLGVGGVVFHTGLIGGLELDYYLDNWLDEAVLFWTKQCKKYPDIVVYIENSFERNPDIFVRLMKQMSRVQNFRICFDYAHAILTPTPMEKWLDSLSPYIGHMHLNDNDLINDLHQVPGEGRIDFSNWKKLFEKYKLNCSVLLELNGLDNIKKALSYMNSLE